jgi:hypothetical protein
MKLILSGILEGISTRNDGSVKITFATQELDSAQAGNLFLMRNKFMKCLLSDTNISEIEEKLVDQESVNGGKKAKTHSQRLRNVMYRVWENGGIPMEFESWYKTEMERIIDRYKEVLNEA